MHSRFSCGVGVLDHAVMIGFLCYGGTLRNDVAGGAFGDATLSIWKLLQHRVRIVIYTPDGKWECNRGRMFRAFKAQYAKKAFNELQQKLVQPLCLVPYREIRLPSSCDLVKSIVWAVASKVLLSSVTKILEFMSMEWGINSEADCCLTLVSLHATASRKVTHDFPDEWYVKRGQGDCTQAILV